MKRWVAIGILSALCVILFLLLGGSYVGFEQVRNQLNALQTELASTQAELEAASDNLASTEADLADCQLSYQGLLSGHGYNITDPTYRQMTNFIKSDRTDKHPYIEGEYVCENFAVDVCNNAEARGIRCAYVSIHYPEGGHAIVAFNTTDRGLVYIEPQTDDEMNIATGKHYWQCGGNFAPPKDYDDTIEKILIVW